jgi:hypothetical protein
MSGPSLVCQPSLASTLTTHRSIARHSRIRQSVSVQRDDAVRRLPDEEVDGAEGWERLTDEPEVRGVEATRHDVDSGWTWSVGVSVMEFIREDPLESEIRNAMLAALVAVPRATAVAEEDREVWIVAGDPSGDALVRAAADVVDTFADRARADMAAATRDHPQAP